MLLVRIVIYYLKLIMVVIILLILGFSVYLNARLYVLQLEYHHKYEASELSNEQLDAEIEKLMEELNKKHSIIGAKRYEIFCDERKKREDLSKQKTT